MAAGRWLLEQTSVPLGSDWTAEAGGSYRMNVTTHTELSSAGSTTTPTPPEGSRWGLMNKDNEVFAKWYTSGGAEVVGAGVRRDCYLYIPSALSAEACIPFLCGHSTYDSYGGYSWASLKGTALSIETWNLTNATRVRSSVTVSNGVYDKTIRIQVNTNSRGISEVKLWNTGDLTRDTPDYTLAGDASDFPSYQFSYGGTCYSSTGARGQWDDVRLNDSAFISRAAGPQTVSPSSVASTTVFGAGRVNPPTDQTLFAYDSSGTAPITANSGTGVGTHASTRRVTQYAGSNTYGTSAPTPYAGSGGRVQVGSSATANTSRLKRDTVGAEISAGDPGAVNGYYDQLFYLDSLPTSTPILLMGASYFTAAGVAVWPDGSIGLTDNTGHVNKTAPGVISTGQWFRIAFGHVGSSPSPGAKVWLGDLNKATPNHVVTMPASMEDYYILVPIANARTSMAAGINGVYADELLISHIDWPARSWTPPAHQVISPSGIESSSAFGTAVVAGSASPQAVSDAGSLSESAGLSVTLLSTDLATATELGNVTASSALADTAALSDTLQHTAELAVNDSVLVDDADTDGFGDGPFGEGPFGGGEPTLVALEAAADAGALTESADTGSTEVPQAVTDTGAFSEAHEAQVSAAALDSGTTSESVSSLVTAPQADSGALSESMAVAQSLDASDAASLTESSSLSIQVASSDAGASSESASLTSNEAASDSGSLSESANAGGSSVLGVTDGASLSEAASLTIGVASSDVGSASESVTPAPVQDAVDSGSLSQSAVANAAIGATDQGAVSESASATSSLTSTDSGATTELGIVDPTDFKAGADSATASQVASLSANVATADVGVVLESVAIEVTAGQEDGGAVADAAALDTSNARTSSDSAVVVESASLTILVDLQDGAALTESAASATSVQAAETLSLSELAALASSAALTELLSVTDAVALSEFDSSYANIINGTAVVDAFNDGTVLVDITRNGTAVLGWIEAVIPDVIPSGYSFGRGPFGHGSFGGN